MIGLCFIGIGISGIMYAIAGILQDRRIKKLENQLKILNEQLNKQ